MPRGFFHKLLSSRPYDLMPEYAMVSTTEF